ncbi:hypothetical protein ACVIW0_007294 [Bradyrhizobium sp. USDA 4454]
MVLHASAYGVRFREVSTPLRLPPPLRGRVGRGVRRERGRTTSGEMVPNPSLPRARISTALHLASEQAAPLSPTLPRKGGGSPSSPVVALPLRRGVVMRSVHEALADTVSREVSTPLRLPPPLRGRVGRGVRRELASTTPGEIAPNHSRPHARISAALHLASEQAAPLSPTLPRKGGGSPSSPVVALHDVVSALHPREVRTALSFPPPLRGRGRERGKPRRRCVWCDWIGSAPCCR